MPIQRTGIYFLLSISALLLFCMLAYPAGYDQSVFSAGGRMIIEQGAVPYRDFLDTKPPIIFYIYATAHGLFGDGILAVRLLDLILQIFSLYVFFRIVKKIFTESTIAILAVFIYTILYVSSGYWMTAQSESYAIIPSLLIFWGVIRFETEELTNGKIVGLGVLLSLCIVILFFLKYTLASIAIGVAGHLFFTSKAPLAKKVSLISYFATGLVIFFAAIALLFEFSGSFGWALQNIAWVSGYSELHPLFGATTIRKVYFHDFPLNLLLTITPTFFILSTIGLFRLHSSSGALLLRSHVGVETLRSLLYWFLATGLFGVLLERKSMPYHYSRVFWICSIVIAFAWTSLARRQERSLERKRFSWKALSLLILVSTLVIFYSPLTKIVSHPLQWAWFAITNNEAAQYARMKSDNFYADERIELEKYFTGKLTPEDNIFLWGHFVEVYILLDKTPTTLCLTNTPLVTAWTPPEWKQQLLSQLEAQRPKYLLVQYDDSYYSFINGRDVDSYTMMRDWAGLNQFVASHYREDTVLKSFKIYARVQ
jgi:4-amino-4-deoxy-L-arabinose transferase-like glycosyltransferase